MSYISSTKEQAYRVAIKCLHYITHPEDIKVVLIAQAHDFRNVCNVRSRVTKEPLSMFYVDPDPKINNKEIYEKKFLKKSMTLFNAIIGNNLDILRPISENLSVT